MSASDDESELDTEGLYQQSFSDMAQLQTRLPEAAVVSLAREVIRRLALQSRDTAPHANDVHALATALIGPAPKAAAGLVEQYLDEGVDVDTIYLDFLGQAANQLGKWWETDQRSFAEVTIGIGRIYAIMRTLRPKILPPPLSNQKSAIFASVPEDQHTLGVKMAADLARESGWDIELLLDLEHDALIDAIAGSGQLLIGLSGAGAHSVPALARAVLALRISAPRAMILISGNIVDAAEDSVQLMHVDALARQFDEAMSEMDRLWNELRQRPIN